MWDALVGKGLKVPSAIALPVAVTCASTLAHKANQHSTQKATWPGPKVRKLRILAASEAGVDQQIRRTRGQTVGSGDSTAFRIQISFCGPVCGLVAFRTSHSFSLARSLSVLVTVHYFTRRHLFCFYYFYFFFPFSARKTLILNT